MTDLRLEKGLDLQHFPSFFTSPPFLHFLQFILVFKVCLWCHGHCWPFIQPMQLHCSLCGGRITVNGDPW